MVQKKKSRYKQGRYKPRYPEKYKGSVDNIIYRSSWELKWCKVFDLNKNVLKWSSESFCIPYNGLDGKSHRYFPDFYIEYINTSGEQKRLLIEVKPYQQTLPPNNKGSKFYGDKMSTFLTNAQKWNEAEKFCHKNNMQFMILTEKSLDKIFIK